MSRVSHIIRKEFIQLRRDPKLVPILFFAPLLQLLLLGFAANLDVKDIPTVVCDQDGTAASRDLVSRFLNSGYFALAGTVAAPREIDLFLEKGKAAVAIVVPRGFANDLAAGTPATVGVIVDGSESQSATIGASTVSMIVSTYAQKLVSGTLDRLRAIGVRPVRLSPEVRVWYNPELRSRNFMVPGILGLVLMVMTMMLTSMAVVREKETGTMEQLIVTPIRPFELIAGKLLPFLIIGAVDVVMIVGLIFLLFRLPMRGSVLLLFGLSLVFMLTTLGLGLFISTVSSNQQQAMLTAVFFMMPMMMFSGFAFPIENMPKIIQAVTYVVPLRYYFVIIRGIYLKGVGIHELWGQGLAMLAFGVVILTLSVLRFRKKVN
ncbi:MAG TPA: ABC transporter permease [Acidobacteriota bacterium]|nr:ABC transporter permease [Acidobacteriota bacterium]